MFSWSPRQRVRIEHIDAEAEALINHFGVEAYSEARRRERGLRGHDTNSPNQSIRPPCGFLPRLPGRTFPA